MNLSNSITKTFVNFIRCASKNQLQTKKQKLPKLEKKTTVSGRRTTTKLGSDIVLCVALAY